MAAHPQPRFTPEEYLAIDRASDTRSEYLDGEIFAMSGGSSNHAYLISRVAHEFEKALEERPCNVSVTSLRLQVAPEGGYFYPDVMVICDEATGAEGDMVSSPVLVVEVLSPSTERWDRVRKFAQYRRVKSLREYVLVSQDEARIEWYTRSETGDWFYREVNGMDAVCRLELLQVDLPLAEIYRKIRFA